MAKSKSTPPPPTTPAYDQQRLDERSEVKHWNERLVKATTVYEQWEKRFECRRLQRYYLGEQWRGLTEEDAKTKYVINLIFPTLEIQAPSLMFYRPQVKVEPRGPHAASTNSDAAGRAELLEDTIQSFIDDPDLHFRQQTLLALRDAWFRFSVVEVGYTADYVDNPNAGKPVLNEHDEPMMAGDQPVIEPPEKLTREQLYVKRIPPECCRISVSSRNILTENDWFAYYEWQYVEDLKANPKYQHTEDLKPTGTVAANNTTPDGSDRQKDADRYQGMVKIWKIWDLRRKVKCVIADHGEDYLLKDEPFAYLPFEILKFYEIPDEFYPLPPVFNWLSPQDEINESREMQRAHRRRFTRKYTTVRGRLQPEELEKLELGGDGTIAVAETDNPLNPVPDADLSGQNWLHLKATKDDFREISGVGGDQRGVPEANTATQANIINVQSQVRESQARVQVADWLSGICRLMALTIRDKMQRPFWIQRNVDPFAQDAVSAARVSQEWEEITSDQLDDLDFDVKIDIASLSPVSEDAQRAAWFQVLQLLKDPTLLAIMQPTPQAPNEPSPLLRKTLGFLGIKSDKEVRQISQVAMQVLQQLQLAMAVAAAQKPGAPMHPMQAGGAPPAAINAPNPGTPMVPPTVQ